VLAVDRSCASNQACDGVFFVLSPVIRPIDVLYNGVEKEWVGSEGDEGVYELSELTKIVCG
jgi:hypothetical protein